MDEKDVPGLGAPITDAPEALEDTFSDEETFGRDRLEPVSEATAGWTTVPDHLMREATG